MKLIQFKKSKLLSEQASSAMVKKKWFILCRIHYAAIHTGLVYMSALALLSPLLLHATKAQRST